MSPGAGSRRIRLAIVATHPVQYAAPWFAFLARRPELELRVFYLSDAGVQPHRDPGFGVTLQWDVPLLDGYASEFVPNRSWRPGVTRFTGLWNPSLAARVRDWAPDAVLLTAYNYATFVDFLCRWRGAPLLFRGDSHRLMPRRGPREVLRKLLIARVFRRFDAVLCVGEANHGYFREHGVDEAKIHRAPHAVDNVRFMLARPQAEAEARTWRESLGIPASHAVVLFAGKFEEKKRPLDLLSAFLEARLADATLLFVGAGPQEAALRAAAQGHGSIRFAGFQNQRAMPRTYAAGDVFVLPSFGPSETWGLAVNEAMCLGRPAIVSTHVGCARDLVVPGVTGLVFEAGSIPALSRALREALQDRARLRTWGDHAARHIGGYDYARATAGLLQALGSLPRPAGAPAVAT